MAASCSALSTCLAVHSKFLYAMARGTLMAGSLSISITLSGLISSV